MHAQMFAGVRVLDLTKVFSGPFASRLFADYGAEVIKIEHPEFPDEARFFPPLEAVASAQNPQDTDQTNSKAGRYWSGYFEILNRNKKSLALDLKNPADREVLYTLAKTADVLVENLTPQVKHSLGISYETLSEINPRLIYASLSGVGQHSNQKYYDVIAQAESGLLSLSGTTDTPMKIGPSVVDAFSGMTLAFGISSALFFREKTGSGQWLDVDMLSCGVQLLEANLTESSLTGKNPERPGNQDTAIAPFGAFRTKDGFVVVAAGNDVIWKRLQGWLESTLGESLSWCGTNQERLANQHRLTEVIERVFGRYSSGDVIAVLQQLSVPVGPVRSMLDVLAQAELFETGALIEVATPSGKRAVVPGKPVRFQREQAVSAAEDRLVAEPVVRAPKLGEHSHEFR